MLSNKVIVITGVSGGLGQALARQFLEQESLVVGIGRSSKALDELLSKLNNKNYSSIVADVSDAQSMLNAVNKIKSDHGRIDCWFNNAAIYPRVNFLTESAQQWAEAMAINVGGIANSCKAVLPLMIEQKRGKIINLGSFADVAPVSDSAVYSSSKGAVHALTKAIAKDIEHLSLDIEIHEWMPGHLKTQMSDFTGIDPDISAAWGVAIASGEIPASKKCTVFENDHEWFPPKSLKQKIRDKLMLWR